MHDATTKFQLVNILLQYRLMTKHTIKNVDSDGNCFYNCMIYACKTWNVDVIDLFEEEDIDEGDHDLHDEYGEEIIVDERTTQVMRLRRRVADILRAEPMSLINLYALYSSDQQLRESLSHQFPLIEHVSSKITQSEFIDYALQQIETDGVWASEIEHSVLCDKMKEHGVDILTITVRNVSDILKYYELEEQILKLSALVQKQSKYAMVLIHVNNSHYMYVTIDDKAIFTHSLLQKHLQNYITSCELEE